MPQFTVVVMGLQFWDIPWKELTVFASHLEFVFSAVEERSERGADGGCAGEGRRGCRGVWQEREGRHGAHQHVRLNILHRGETSQRQGRQARR